MDDARSGLTEQDYEISGHHRTNAFTTGYLSAQQLCMFFITDVFVADTAIASVVATRTAATKTTKTTGGQTIMPATRLKTGRPLLNVFV